MISNNLFTEPTTSTLKKRENTSRTPMQGNRTPIMINTDQRQTNSLENSKTPTLQTEPSKSTLRLDKSQTGSTSSYKSSSITGPQETQESMTFAVNELGNKVSKSTFSGDGHDEEEFTAQFEPFKSKVTKGQNDWVKGSSALNTVVITGEKSGSSVSSLQKGGWKEVMENMRKQSEKGGGVGENVKMSGNVESKRAVVTNSVQSLLEVNDLKTGRNLMKVSVQQQMSVPPKSPVVFNQHYQDILKNLSNVPRLERVQGKEQIVKGLEKDTRGVQNPSKTVNFKDYLQRIQKGASKNVTPGSIPNQQTNTIKPRQEFFDLKPELGKASSNTNISQNTPALLTKTTPRKQVNEKIREARGLMTAGVKTMTTISSGLTNSAGQLYPKSRNNNLSPGRRSSNRSKTKIRSDEKAKAAFQIMNLPPVKSTHMVAGLPVIFEDPEIHLKVKKSGSKQKLEKEEKKSQESKASLPRAQSWNELEEESQFVGSDSESEYESDSEGSSEDGDEYEESESGSVSASQGGVRIACEDKKQGKEGSVGSKSQTERYTQDISEESEEEEASGTESEDESETGSGEVSEESGDEETQEEGIEKYRSAQMEERLRESVDLVPEGCGEESEGEEGSSGSEEYELEESSESHSCTQEPMASKNVQYEEVREGVDEKGRYQQFQELIMAKGGNQRRMQDLEEPYVRNYDYSKQNRNNNYTDESPANKESLAKLHKDVYEDQRDVFFRHSSLGSLEFILKKYHDIESKLWDIQGRQWMFDKEVRLMQVSLKVLDERIDILYDLAEDRFNKKDGVLSLTSSELNQIFEDNI